MARPIRYEHNHQSERELLEAIQKVRSGEPNDHIRRDPSGWWLVDLPAGVYEGVRLHADGTWTCAYWRNPGDRADWLVAWQTDAEFAQAAGL